MKAESFIKILNCDFYTGVPDSKLKALCNYLIDTYGIDGKHHIIAANEGNCTAIAAGYYLATKKIPVVYMQNSGEGNIINPAASLLNDKVYAIPEIFIIGWRGEPNLKDEPQHIFQGQITLKLLDVMDIKYFIVSKETTEEELVQTMSEFRKILDEGKQVAFVITKEALTYSGNTVYKNGYNLRREEVIEHIVKFSGEDTIISTTGKISRELFEIRERNKQTHNHDFLTVGSMGHCSSVALGVAINKPDKKIWCIDGDGSMLMHMGAMAVIGANKPKNLVHIIINNSAHETVGGMPTVADKIDICSIAKGCGYINAVCVDNFINLDTELNNAKMKDELSLIEIKCSVESRNNLMRPDKTPVENKNVFIRYL